MLLYTAMIYAKFKILNEAPNRCMMTIVFKNCNICIASKTLFQSLSRGVSWLRLLLWSVLYFLDLGLTLFLFSLCWGLCWICVLPEFCFLFLFCSFCSSCESAFTSCLCPVSRPCDCLHLVLLCFTCVQLPPPPPPPPPCVYKSLCWAHVITLPPSLVTSLCLLSVFSSVCGFILSTFILHVWVHLFLKPYKGIISNFLWVLMVCALVKTDICPKRNPGPVKKYRNAKTLFYNGE